MRIRRLPLSFVILLPLIVLPARAEEGAIPRCSLEVAGSLSCQANVACECKYFHASAAHGTPAGYRWDCGIRRPKCGIVPADAGYGGPYPEAIAIDRSTEINTQSQESTQSATSSGTP